jgi:hypothetical protein
VVVSRHDFRPSWSSAKTKYRQLKMEQRFELIKLWSFIAGALIVVIGLGFLLVLDNYFDGLSATAKVEGNHD